MKAGQPSSAAVRLGISWQLARYHPVFGMAIETRDPSPSTYRRL